MLTFHDSFCAENIYSILKKKKKCFLPEHFYCFLSTDFQNVCCSFRDKLNVQLGQENSSYYINTVAKYLFTTDTMKLTLC